MWLLKGSERKGWQRTTDDVDQRRVLYNHTRSLWTRYAEDRLTYHSELNYSYKAKAVLEIVYFIVNYLTLYSWHKITKDYRVCHMLICWHVFLLFDWNWHFHKSIHATVVTRMVFVYQNIIWPVRHLKAITTIVKPSR